MSVSGTSIKSGSLMSGSLTGVASKPPAKVPPHLAVRCRTCGELCDDEQHLMVHKLWAMKITGDHIHCTVCGMDFEKMETQRAHILEVGNPKQILTAMNTLESLTRLSQMHPQEQNIVCPGCQRRFVRLAGWMKHLEHNECPGIKRMDVDKNRAEKLTFAHELEKRNGSQFGDYFSVSHPSVQSAMSVVSKPYMAHPSFFKPSDFPQLEQAEGIPRQDDGSEGSSISKDLTIPSTPGAQNAESTANAPKIEDINNPYHHRFDARKYYNPFTRKYKCPQGSCT